MKARKIESATLVFCIFQLLLVIIGGAGYAMLAYRVNHFDYGKLRIDEDKILEAVQYATKAFLHDYQTNVEHKVEIHTPSTEIKECNGIIYGTLRSHRARISRSDYSVGDYIKEGTNLYTVVYLDFERQRLYARNDVGDNLILCMIGIDTPKERLPIDERNPALRRRADEGRDNAQRMASPFSI